jgi:integrase
MSMCGLRRGEACGLAWDDLDLDEGVAYISRQLQEGSDGQLRACQLKTESSLRAVALDSETIIVLRAHRSRQERHFIKAGVTPAGWVFTRADTYLSVAVELGLKAAAAAARLVLNAGKSPPGDGSARRRSAPVLAEITA